MKISQDVRDYADENGLNENDVFSEGMKEKSKEFLQAGAEIYLK
jgi:phosphomethylpyrimidine synthase